MALLTALRQREKGFTLLELLVALAVAAILTVLVAPSFGGFLARQQLTSDINEILSVLSFARSEAIKRSDTVNADIDQNTVWQVTVSVSGTDLRRANGSNDNITLDDESGSLPLSVTFDELGAAAGCPCRLQIGHADLEEPRNIVIGRVGSVRVERDE